MEELIKVSEERKVSAKDLYEFLAGEKSHYSRWCKTNIENNDFAEEGTDYIGFATVANGNESTDYALTIDFAKELCMLSKCEKGKQARKYFIEVEKKYKQQVFTLPQTYSEALRALADKAEENEKQKLLLAEQQPKVEFFDAVAESKTAVDIASVAKVLNIQGIGRNKLFEILRNKKILMNNNQPYQKYIDCNYFRTVEQKFNKPDGSVNINIKTLVYQKGVQYIKKILSE